MRIQCAVASDSGNCVPAVEDSLQAARVLSLRVGKEVRESVAAPTQFGVVCEDFKDWNVGDLLVGDDAGPDPPASG